MTLSLDQIIDNMIDDEETVQKLLILISSIVYYWVKSSNELFYQDEFFSFLENCEEIIVTKSNERTKLSFLKKVIENMGSSLFCFNSEI